MKLLGYIVQSFHEDKFLPETGYKQLYTSYTDALTCADTLLKEYLTANQNNPQPYFEHHTPTKKQVDENGYAIIFRNSELQLWIEVVITR